MKILRKKEYDDLINQIKVAESKIRDQKKYYEDKNSELNKKITDLEKEKCALTSELEKLTENLKRTEDILVTKENKLIKIRQEKVKINQQKIEFYSRIGGLTKENNKLKKEIEDKNQKIENLKEDFRKNHKKLTVNQYDKRLKGINKKEN